MPGNDTLLADLLSPRLLFTSAGTPRHVDSCGARLLLEMRDNPEDYIIELNLIDHMKNLFIAPAILKAPWTPHSYATKRFTHDLQPIHHRKPGGGVVQTQWSTKYNYPREQNPAEAKPYIVPGAAPVTSDHLWAKLLLGTFTLGVKYREEDKPACLLLDIDFARMDGSDMPPLLELLDAERAQLMEALARSVARVESRLGELLHPRWMASGGKGCWLHLFFNGPCPRYALDHLLGQIIDETPDAVGEYRVTPCSHNLQKTPCRIPLSRHMNGKQAV